MNLIRRTLISVQNNYPPIFTRSVAYKSNISLENLYPQSPLHLTTPIKPSTSLCPKFTGYIPIEQLDITYTRSSGPGGQNVNKVNTKVNLRFHLQSATWLNDEIKAKLSETLKTRISKEGFLIFRSELTRSQQLNLADCLNKLRMCILEATYEAPPVSEETMEKIRKRQEKNSRQRLIQKRIRSQTKSDRQAPGDI